MVAAKYPLISIETYEETRTTGIVNAISIDAQRKCFTWSQTQGLRDVPDGKPVGHSGAPDITFDLMDALGQIEKMSVESSKGYTFIMKDCHKLVDNPVVQRKIRDLFESLKNTTKVIIFLSPSFPIPEDLQKSITTIDIPLPNAAELEEILYLYLDGLETQEANLRAKLEDHPNKAEAIKAQLKRTIEKREFLERQIKNNKQAILSAGLGLTCDEFEDVIAKCFVLGTISIKTILGEKKQIIQKSGILEFFETEESAKSIGGLKVLKGHIASLSSCFSPDAHDFGIDPPRGFLVIGIPGTGKSLTAKATANELQLPLLKLDMSQLVSSLYGKSTNNMKAVWKLARALAPCILWVDEIEKALGTGQGGEMHEETARLFGVFLTEMEESQGVFVVATCNDHVALRAELMSRFPRMFFVDTPTRNELREIITIHLEKVHRNPKDFDIERILDAAAGFVGREVRNAIQESLTVAFNENVPSDKKKLTTDHIVAQFGRMKPITEQKKEVLESMRIWANRNATNASEEEVQVIAPRATASSRATGNVDDDFESLIKG